MKKRVLVVCPGRGSYDRSCLGQLHRRSAAATEVIAACDRWRAAAGTPTITELDSAERYRPTVHMAGEHASLLTFACSLADLADLDRDRFDVVGVVGNSMGWYTTLAAAGALSLEDAIQLVDTMGSYQTGNVIGGQVLYPLTDSDWRPDSTLRDRVEGALLATRDAGHQAWWSIDLGGFAVLAGDTEGVRHLLSILPPDERSGRTFPVQLPMHSAFHTPLMAASSARARHELSLNWRAPTVPMIDGRGFVFRPRWAAGLPDYTLVTQVVERFDFAMAIKTALHHCAPDVVVTLGPGNALGGNVARVLLWDHWRGLTRRQDFVDRQDGDEPMLLSFGIDAQRSVLVKP